MNQIDDVCKDIEKTINLTVQNTLNTLEHDCEQIAELIDNKLAVDRFDACLVLKYCNVGIIDCSQYTVIDLLTCLCSILLV